MLFSVIQFLKHLFHLFLLVLPLCSFFLVPGFSFLVSQPSSWRCTRPADNSMPISGPVVPPVLNSSLSTSAPCPTPIRAHPSSGSFLHYLALREAGQTSPILQASVNREMYNQIPGTSSILTLTEMRNTHLPALCSGYYDSDKVKRSKFNGRVGKRKKRNDKVRKVTKKTRNRMSISLKGRH